LFENILKILKYHTNVFGELNCNKLTTLTYLVIDRDVYVTLVHIMGNIIARYY